MYLVFFGDDGQGCCKKKRERKQKSPPSLMMDHFLKCTEKKQENDETGGVQIKHTQVLVASLFIIIFIYAFHLCPKAYSNKSYNKGCNCMAMVKLRFKA